MIVVVKLTPEEAMEEIVHSWNINYFNVQPVNTKELYENFITYCKLKHFFADEFLVGYYDKTGGVGTELKHFIRDNFDKIKEEIQRG